MNALVKAYVSDVEKRPSVLSDISSVIQSKAYKILDLVQALEEQLTSSDAALRNDACQLLTFVLTNLPNNGLSREELNVIVVFMCSRLQDHYSLHPTVLDSLCWASSSGHLTDQSSEMILRALFKEIHVQSCLQADRYKVFNILANIFDRHKNVISGMGRDFLQSFIQAIDGEQDPRSLYIVFQLVTNIVKSGFDLSNLEEDLFEVTSCYFPIDFNPTADSKRASITNQDLVQGLRDVLSSTRLFARFCITLMLEKVDSDLQSAKVDSLLTLSAALNNYTREDLQPYTHTIWQAIKREVTHALSEEVEKCGLQLLTELIRNMSDWPIDEKEGTNVDLNLFLDEIIEDCMSHIKEPIEDKLKWMSFQLILSCAKASADSCNYVIKGLFPYLLEQSLSKVKQVPTSKEHLPPILKLSTSHSIDSLVQLLVISKSFTFQQHPVQTHKRELLHLTRWCLSNDCTSAIKCAAVTAYTAVLGQNLFDREEIEATGLLFLELATKKDCTKRLRHEILGACSYLASLHSYIVKQYMLPKIFDDLQTMKVSSKENDTLSVLFDLLSSLATHIEVLQEIIKPLMTMVAACRLDEEHSVFLMQSLKCLQVIATASMPGNEFNDSLALNMCLPLIKMCVQASLETRAPGLCCSNCDVTATGFSNDCISLPLMQSASSVVRTVCQKLHPGKSAVVIANIISDLYVNHDILSFDIKDTQNSFSPLDPSIYPLQTRTVCFLTATLCAFNRQIKLLHVDKLQDKLLELGVNSNDLPTYVAASKALAGLINKQDTVSQELLQKIIERSNTAFGESSKFSKNSNKLQSLTVLIWTTKALAQRGHPETCKFVQQLFNKFDDPEVGAVSAAGFNIILRESDEVLNAASHAIIKMMYKQRFFLLVLPKIVDGFHSIKDDQNESLQRKKANYLTALAELLVLIPKQVLLQQFSSLMPLLIQSLGSQVPSLLLSVLSALLCLIQDSPGTLEAYVDTLLDNFMRLSKFDSDLNIRIKAVTCIGATTLLPVHCVLPSKSKVIRNLATVLDDRKRAVRSEAAKARSEWSLLGT